jgi:hypothetical protein
MAETLVDPPRHVVTRGSGIQVLPHPAVYIWIPQYRDTVIAYAGKSSRLSKRLPEWYAQRSVKKTHSTEVMIRKLVEKSCCSENFDVYDK